MKRFIAVIGITLMFVSAMFKARAFDTATTTGASLKAFFWFVTSIGALLAFIDDLLKDKWPF